MIRSDLGCGFVGADESIGLAVILTSPDLLQTVGLPARRQGTMIVLQTGKDNTE
jgi:hypothetical protein